MAIHQLLAPPVTPGDRGLVGIANDHRSGGDDQQPCECLDHSPPIQGTLDRRVK